jgi:aminoglycoside 3-N-acetyltransferase
VGNVTARPAPHQRKRLAGELAAAGLPAGRHVLVHCSMREVGPVEGGPATLLAALRGVIGPDATVVSPAQTANNSTTSHAFLEATRDLTPDHRIAYEHRMPGFDRDSTPSYRMGAFAEYVRTLPGAVRSAHPQASFVGLGSAAAQLMAVHDLDSHLGERSPLAALYATGASILMLGVGFDRCSSFHLAEHRLPWPPPMRPYQCYIQVNGRRAKLDFEGVNLIADDFDQLGEAVRHAPFVRSGAVGDTTAIVMPITDAVDFAIGWMTRHRSPEGRPLLV